jgi:hypothetical protein
MKYVIILGFCSICTFAQTPQAADQERDRARIQPGTSASGVEYIRPLTVAQKYEYCLHRVFNEGEAARMAFGTGIDQWRSDPREWGQGWDAFGARAASHFGQHLVKEHLAFAVRALDHEDPRPIRSTRPGFAARAVDALKYTVVARSDSGHLMPAYSRFVDNYGAAAISKFGWWPRRYQTAGEILSSGTAAIGVDAGMNVLREFWPDIKRKFHR